MPNKKLTEAFDNVLSEGPFISNAIATFMTYKFAIMLKTPFKDWQANKLGLIDDEGNILRDPETTTEKSAINPLMNLIRKVKRIMHKVVPSTGILSTLVALYLITESKLQNHLEIKEEMQQELTEEEFVMLSKILDELKEGIEE